MSVDTPLHTTFFAIATDIQVTPFSCLDLTPTSSLSITILLGTSHSALGWAVLAHRPAGHMGSQAGPGYQNFRSIESPRPLTHPYEASWPVDTPPTPHFSVRRVRPAVPSYFAVEEGTPDPHPALHFWSTAPTKWFIITALVLDTVQRCSMVPGA